MFNPMHPGEVLKESYLEPLNISVTEAAKRLGVARKTLSELINTRSDVSVEMAHKLAKACNTTPKFWLNMQVNYDFWQSRDMDFEKVQAFA
ncbi:HigA family addiction module antitoxin [Endozoicomonas euniceicola]|uniref:HigA family addiction module antitoxin n=1 Tax=Endozoicomonas euniceicola TaxID=1234143 RepID=A0ABY6GXQ5_9GAMM|nr:HigA family addiction module antitoxin [Endozoicomonas euniceicola]UYM17557.1 HigA family addiction module antitoxin [Endozoicomonas euniceicola]